MFRTLAHRIHISKTQCNVSPKEWNHLKAMGNHVCNLHSITLARTNQVKIYWILITRNVLASVTWSYNRWRIRYIHFGFGGLDSLLHLLERLFCLLTVLYQWKVLLFQFWEYVEQLLRICEEQRRFLTSQQWYNASRHCDYYYWYMCHH